MSRKWEDGPGSDFAKNFGARLKAYMADAGVTGTELANVIGAQRSSISKYTKGTTTPPLGCLTKMAQYLGVSLDRLVGINDAPLPEVKPRSVMHASGKKPTIRDRLSELERRLSALEEKQ